MATKQHPKAEGRSNTLILSGFLRKERQQVLENGKLVGIEDTYLLTAEKNNIISDTVCIYDAITSFVGDKKVPDKIEIDLLFTDDRIPVDLVSSIIDARMKGKVMKGYMQARRTRREITEAREPYYEQRELLSLANSRDAKLFQSITEELQNNKGKFAVLVISKTAG